MAGKSIKNVAFQPIRAYISIYLLHEKSEESEAVMPLMSQIRNNLGKLFAVFAFIFIAYIMLDWGMELTTLRRGGTGDTVGEVNGDKISYREFSEVYRRAVEAQRAQSGQEPDPELERQIRSQVWNTLVSQLLINQEIERIGITVTDAEIVNLVHGPNPPEELVSMFRDSTGTFNRAAYDRAIADPQNRNAWLEVERRLREQLRQQKLQSLLLATVRVSDAELRQRFAERTVTMEALYALFDPSTMVPDSLVEVTEADIERYYREHQEEFKVRPARKLSYVMFSLAPSTEDTADVVAELERLKREALSGADFLELARTSSEIPATKAFYKPSELSRAKADVFSAKAGDLIGPLRDFDGFHLIKVTNTRRGSETFVRAAHILVPVGADSAASLRQARELLSRIRAGEDFAALARQHGTDGSAPEGGDLGWGSRTTWVKPFADAVFRANVGEVLGPVRTQFGYHVIKVLDRTNKEVELTDLAIRVKASSQSIDRAYQQAQDFVYLAGEEGFENAARNSSVQIRETPEFTKGGAIPQIGFNDAVMNFAFSASMGDISEPIGMSAGVGVFRLSGIREEGVRPLADVKNITRSMVVRERKMEKVRERARAVHAAIPRGGSLRMVAASFPDVTVRSTGPFKASEPPTSIGRDLAFIGMAESLEPGQVSPPFRGARGYYIMEMTSKTPLDSTQYASRRDDLMRELLQEKRTRFSQDWVAVLRERAEIADYRDRFFR